MENEKYKVIWRIDKFTRESLSSNSNTSIIAEKRVDLGKTPTNWLLLLMLRGASGVALCVSNDNYENSSGLKLTVSVLKSDQKNQRIGEIVMKPGEKEESLKRMICDLFDYKFALNKESKYITDNGLTLIIKFQIKGENRSKSTASTAEASSDSMAHYFASYVYSDLVITCSDSKEIYGHRNIIASRSPILDRMIRSQRLESKTNLVKVDDVDGETMYELLRYVYTRKVENIETLASKLLYAADKYDIPVLKKQCSTALISQLTVDNAIEILSTADKYNDEELLYNCMDFIESHFEELEKKKEWVSIDNVLMLKLLKFFRNPLCFASVVSTTVANGNDSIDSDSDDVSNSESDIY